MDLFDALEKYRDVQFRYGKADCCLFVADVLKETTGRDYAEPWRGYKGKRGALKILAEHAGLAGLATAAFGPMRGPLCARRGDPVLVGPPWIELDEIGEALGIFDGAGVICLTDKGLQRVPLTAVRGAWNV